MQTVIRHFILAAAMLAAIGALPVGESQATACPNCKAANESDPLKPKAYMYSILFMIGMPATIFTGFSVSFWRMTRQAQLEQELSAADEADSDDN
jgi:hypothetical protein